MTTLRSIYKVSGPTLTISVPPDFAGQQVEVIVQPVQPEQDPRFAPFLLAKPALTEEDLRLFQQSPYPLRGTGGKYLDPFAPAVPLEDWNVYREARKVSPDDPA